MNTVLVIGGTGSLASKLVPLLLKRDDISRIRILSRGEHRQIEMARRMKEPRLDFIIGDCRDRLKMIEATENCGTVFHLAAYKDIGTAEYNAREAIKTNIYGTENVIDACRYNGVGRAIFISTDKAVNAINVYGRTKGVAESEWIQANCGNHHTSYSVARYGNVFGSNSSVLMLWRDGHITLTDELMTRFFISQRDAAAFVLKAWEEMRGGEIFIPKMKSTTVKRLMEIVTGHSKYEVIGVRPGEKIHEELITSAEAPHTTDVGWGYVRWPLAKLFPFVVQGSVLTDGFALSSDAAPKFSDEEIKGLLDDWMSDLEAK